MWRRLRIVRVLWVLFEALAFGWLLLTGLGYTGTLARKVDRNLQQQREAIMMPWRAPETGSRSRQPADRAGRELKNAGGRDCAIVE